MSLKHFCAASSALAANVWDDEYHKPCNTRGLSKCDAGWTWHIGTLDKPCECTRPKTDKEKEAEVDDLCAYWEGLCYESGKNYKFETPNGEVCGRLQVCNNSKYTKFCRKSRIEGWTYQCSTADYRLTAGDKKEIARRKAKKAADEKKRKKDEADQEADGKKAYCKIIKPDCYKKGSTHKNYNDKSNSCNQMKDNCSKAENDKLCADAKKNKWLWQCR